MYTDVFHIKTQDCNTLRTQLEKKNAFKIIQKF